MKFLISVLSVLLISGCAGTYKEYYQSFRLALEQDKGTQLTADYVEKAPYDYLQVTNYEGINIAMVLGYIDEPGYKWVAADKSVLVINNGLIVRTVSSGNDLNYISGSNTDPLKGALSQQTTSWERLVDVDPNQYGLKLSSQFSHAGEETISFDNIELQTNKVVEQVKSNSGESYVNHYWLSTKDGAVLKSRQIIAPGFEPLELLYLSRIVRLAKGN